MHKYILAGLLTFSAFFAGCAGNRTGSVRPPVGTPSPKILSDQAILVSIRDLTTERSEIVRKIEQRRKEVGASQRNDPVLIGLFLEKMDREKKIKSLEAKLSPEARKLRRGLPELASEHIATPREVRRRQEIASAPYRAHVVGCTPGSVMVDPAAVPLDFGITVRFNISNPNSVPVDIRDNILGRNVVGNLCPQGRLSLVQVFPVFSDHDSRTVSYTAFGIMEGQVVSNNSPSATLSVYNTSAIEPVKWEIALPKPRPVPLK